MSCSIKKGFSIAEALMVLLIMSIIVAVSIPVITKKSKRKTTKVEAGLWRDYRHEFLMPVDNRDITLGDETNQRGIRIKGKLTLKNLEGKEIGWVKDDGSTSFEEIPPGMMMTFIGKERCPDGWMLANGGTVDTQYGTQITPDFTSILAKISETQGEHAPTLAICVKCSPRQHCKYSSVKERRRY